MYYNIKISNEAIEQIKNILGFNPKQINLKTGIICVTEIEEIKRVAQKFGVENVNRKPYEDVVIDPATKSNNNGSGEKASKSEEKNKTNAHSKKNVEKTVSADKEALKKRKEIVGQKLELGTITRIKDEEKVRHVVIVGRDGDKYLAMEILLQKPSKDDDTQIMLQKNRDVVFVNPTYKDIVTVGSNLYTELEEDDFIKISGGLIVGRIVNSEIMDAILGQVWPDNDSEAEEEHTEETPTINFEDVVESTKSWEERLDRIKASDDLRLLVSLAVERNTKDLKRLIQVMQKEYYKNFTQSDIKRILESQLVNTGVGPVNLEMNERTLAYFLKMITSE